jgi:hypothetical protein
MIHETIKPTGELKVVLSDKNGVTKQEFLVPNLVVTAGRNFIAARMTDTSQPADMSHMAVGSSATAAALGDTTVGTELGRVTLTGAEGVPSTNTIVYTATFPAGTGTGALVEAGIFNGAGADTMLCRTTFSVVNKGADDSVTITWTVTIA